MLKPEDIIEAVESRKTTKLTTYTDPELDMKNISQFNSFKRWVTDK